MWKPKRRASAASSSASLASSHPAGLGAPDAGGAAPVGVCTPAGVFAAWTPADVSTSSRRRPSGRGTRGISTMFTCVVPQERGGLFLSFMTTEVIIQQKQIKTPRFALLRDRDSKTVRFASLGLQRARKFSNGAFKRIQSSTHTGSNWCAAKFRAKVCAVETRRFEAAAPRNFGQTLPGSSR